MFEEKEKRREDGEKLKVKSGEGGLRGFLPAEGSERKRQSQSASGR